MLRSLHINGFRSLLNCSVELRPGVNILVGANGSGKTNILMFFEFLAALFEHSAHEAVSRLGGVGKIFSRTGKTTLAASIDAELIGDGEWPGDGPDGTPEVSHYEFEYKFSLAYAENLRLVYFNSQDFKFRRIPASTNPLSPKDSKKWDIHISQSASIENDRVIDAYTVRDVNHDGVNGRMGLILKDIGKKNRKNGITTMLRNPNTHRHGFPLLLGCSDYFPEISEIISNFSRSKVIDVIPGVAKKSDDSATRPGMDPDGGRLAATLHTLEALKGDPNSNSTDTRSSPRGSPMVDSSERDFFPTKSAYLLIEEHIRTVNPEIQSIEVEEDDSSNLMTVFATLRSEDGTVRLPLSLLSDGAVNYLALVTALLTSRSMLALEEPENHLHPPMREKIIKAIRESFETEDKECRKDRFIILTTHSETLLDYADPSELILVSIESGATQTRRPKDVEKIRAAIGRTCFDLVHLYLTEVLEDV